MRNLAISLVFLLGICLFIGPSWAGTGGADDPGAGKNDVDQALRTAVRWIVGMKGLKVVQTERTADFNFYSFDQKAAGAGILKAISDGLTKRKWKVSSVKNTQVHVLEATKNDQRVRVSLAQSGKEPRLTLEIRNTKEGPDHKVASVVSPNSPSAIRARGCSHR